MRTLVFPARHTVFPIFAASARHWWGDRPLYAHYPAIDQFRYPPTFAVAVTPFAALGLRAGGILWTWLNVAAYVVGLWRFADEVVPGPWPPARRAAFMALSAPAALCGLWNAQSNALAVGLLLLAAASLLRQRWWATAGLLAASVWLKLTPLAPALLLCALWPRRLAPRFAVALALGSLPPFLTRPPGVVLEQYADWVAHLVQSGSSRWPGFRDGWTLWVVVRHLGEWRPGPPPLLAPIDSPVYHVLQLLGAGLALAWCLRQRARGTDPRRLACAVLGMGAAWLMLFGPSVEPATYAFLAPSLAWALLERGQGPGGRLLAWAAFALIAVLGWDSLTGPLLGRVPLLAASLPLGSALFVLWLVGCGRAGGTLVPLTPRSSPPGNG